MKYTENYNLKKPDYSNLADIPEHYNSNFDTIDTLIKDNSDNINGLAGAGRTDETVKKNADDIAAHKAEDVSNINGIHGIKIESGTWTPSWGTATYAERNGIYVRINNLVYIFGRLVLATKGDAAFTISGLPFTANAQTKHAPLTLGQFGNISFGASEQIYSRINEGANSIGILKSVSGAGVNTINNTDLKDNSYITFAGVYQI